MKTKFFIMALAIAAGLFGTQRAQALVDLKNANYSDAWLDMTLPGSGFDLKVERGYNSRTLFNGMFGFGWCSGFETSLDITPEGNLKFIECGAGLEILYQAKTFTEKDIDKTIKTIIEKVRAENPSAPATYFSDLQKRLKTEAPLRGEYANKFGIIRPVADKTRFYANGRETDYIEKAGNNYSRQAPDGTTQKFKLNGRLEKVFDRNGNYLTFTYDGKLLRDITDNAGRKISFQYHENGKVKSITGPGNLKTEYKFKNLNDLSWVKAASGNIYQYEYDDLHNMTKIVFPDKTTKEIGYNKNKDWVISYKDQEGCVEKYDYRQSDDNPSDHFWATVEKKCQAKVVTKAKYEFWYAMKGDRTGKFLQKSSTQENETKTDVTYNELGRPLVIVANGKTTKFGYYENGLLHKKTMPDGVVTTLYYDNPFKKVSKVERAGKTSEFGYDPKGNLVKASNSDGQRITLGYDGKGRIAVIEDQAKRKVKIQYEDRFGKPSVIEREGVGSISVTYTTKGDIDKVKSAAGSSVAIQVASTFNNLLDLIQPAGVNLNF
jgi:YD repeat-containing protein